MEEKVNVGSTKKSFAGEDRGRAEDEITVTADWLVVEMDDDDVVW